MNRLFKTLRNFILIGVLVTLFLALSGFRLTAVSAHKASEKGVHYGPSEIVKIIDHGSYKHLLCRYDKWISCNTVKRNLLFLWSAGNQPTGFENESDKPIDYSFAYSPNSGTIYGIANDDSITKIELRLSDSEFYIQNDLYDHLFYFNWSAQDGYWTHMKLIGFDDSGAVVYETESP